MRNLRRRIAALETLRCVSRDRQQAIVKLTLDGLWLDSAESLLAAYGTDRTSRPHTEQEAAARQAFAKALQRECRSARVPPIADADVDPRVVMKHGRIQVLAQRLTPQELDLCIRGSIAAEQGRALSEDESAALESYRAVLERISLLAGFDSVAEFEAFLGRGDEDEHGDHIVR